MSRTRWSFFGLCEVDGDLRIGAVLGEADPELAGGPPEGLGAVWTARGRWQSDRSVRLGSGRMIDVIHDDDVLFGVVTRPPGSRAAPIRDAVLHQLPRASEKVGTSLWIVDANGAVLHETPGERTWIEAIAPSLPKLLRPRPWDYHLGGEHFRILPMAGHRPTWAVLRLAARPVKLPPLLALSPTQREVAQFAASGATIQEIARAMERRPETIRSHLALVYDKLGIGSRAELAARCEIGSHWWRSLREEDRAW